MGKSEERNAHLRADIEELRIQAEKSNVAYETTNKFHNLLSETNAYENYSLYYKTIKETLSQFLEYLRDQIEVIRKASPSTADRLTRQVEFHEKISNELLEVVKKSKSSRNLDKKLNDIEFQKKIADMTVNSLRVKEAVETCYQCILDTLDLNQDDTLTK